jgi:hypothetical protein
MQITTHRCRQFQHPEFVLEADDSIVPRDNIQRIAGTLEEMVAGGSVFKPDQTFQIGWSLTLVKPYDKSRLTLVEADMQSMPIKWVPGITQSLRQMMLQLFMLDSVRLRSVMQFSNFRHSLIACTRYTETEFLMDRAEEEDHASGWYIGCQDEDHDHNDPDNLQLVSLYEAFLNQPALVNFLAFPTGSAISVKQSEGVKVLFNDAELPTEPGSFLDEWAKRYLAR